MSAAAVYASGEVPMVGDVVECVDDSGSLTIKLGQCLTVVDIRDANYQGHSLLQFADTGTALFENRVKLIRRKQEPAMSGAWIKGAPAFSGDYRLMVRGESMLFTVTGFANTHHTGREILLPSDPITIYSDSIEWHLPLAPPPELPPAPIPFPEWRRGTYHKEPCIAFTHGGFWYVHTKHDDFRMESTEQEFTDFLHLDPA